MNHEHKMQHQSEIQEKIHATQTQNTIGENESKNNEKNASVPWQPLLFKIESEMSAILL